MGVTTVESVLSRVDYVARCIEIGLADLKVNYVPSLGFEFPGTSQRQECGFRA